MTEERILRVTDFEGYDYAALPAWFKLRLISDDPAPPKDWKPYCYDEEHNICSLVGLVNEPPKCWKECPYRKRSD